MKHIVLTRMSFDDDDLFFKYFEVMRNIYIPSIKSQTNQNFEIGLIIKEKHITYIKEYLNERINFFPNFSSVKEYCFSNNIELQTRHDCDDWMSNDYIEAIQNVYHTNKDNYDCMIIHSKVEKLDYYTSKLHKHIVNYKKNGYISMFLTLYQKNVVNFVYDKNHRFMNEICDKIILLDNSYTRLVIHNNNKLSKISENESYFDIMTNYDLSIVIPTFNNVDYIEDCLNSLIKTIKDFNIEILIGIDNCLDTLKHISKNFLKYPNNFRFFYFNKKVGPYIIRNTLTNISKSKKILFIDSDDIVDKNLVPSVISNLNNFDVVRFKFYNFKKNTDLNYFDKKNINSFHSIGQLGIKKEKFYELNGFEPWICSADSEFKQRESKNNFLVKYLDDILYFRRRHNKNLTITSETGVGSKIRENYNNIIKSKANKKDFNKLLKLHIYNFIEYNGNPNLNYFLDKKTSIIIPTYKNTSFIDECINSVINSCQGLDVEILIGIDSCTETLDYIKNKSFDNRIKFFFFDNKVGPYIIKNSLSKIANSDTLLFFDSDDIMNEKMISYILNLIKTNDFIKPMYSDFTNEPNYNIIRTKLFGEGVFAIKKDLFLSMNGFEPWPVAADSEFMGRLYKNNKKLQYTNEVVFYRRIHPNSLTQSKQTGLTSPLRGKYFNMSKRKTNFGPLPKLVTSSYYEVDTIKTYNSNTNVDKVEFIPKKDLTKTILTHSKTIDYDRINQLIKNSQQNNIKPNPKIDPPKKVINKPISRNEINDKKNSQRHSLAKLSIKKK